MTGQIFTITGKMSVFGGPDDHGIAPDEGLALVEPGEEKLAQFAGLFLPEQPPVTTGLARRLDPSAFYVACRWDYDKTPREWLRRQSVTVENIAIGAKASARPVDWGPNEDTGRVADLSPRLATALGLKTDDGCVVTIPLPQPMGSTKMATPNGFVTWVQYILEDEGSEVNQSSDEPGGISVYGVSLSAYGDYCKANNLPSPTTADIAAMTAAKASDFYAWFFSTLLLDQFPPAVAYRIADIVTNLGRTGGVEAVGVALGLFPVPTVMTPAVVSVVNALDPAQFVCSLSGVWLENKHADAAGWVKYGNGWTARRNKAHARAVGLLAPAKVAAVVPAPVWPLQSQCLQFYGDPRQAGWLQANTVDVACPWPLFYGKIPVSHILFHKRCADSLKRVLDNIWDAVGHDVEKIKQLRYDQFSGSYNLRLMRGGTAMSMHSFAVALDVDADENVFHSEKHLFTDDSLIVVKFKEEGAIWGGDWSPGSIDAQHFQFARVHP